MISSLLHLVGLRPRVCYTLTNFRGGGGQDPLAPPQYANAPNKSVQSIYSIVLPMNLTVFCSCEPASLKYIHLVFDALKSKLCDAATSVHVLSIAFNAMLVGANNVTSSA